MASVDGLGNKVAIGLLASRRVGAETHHCGALRQQLVGQAQGKAAIT
jgi:hypothetical protein